MLYPLGYNNDGAKSAMSKTSEGSQGALAYQRIIEAVQAGSYVPGDRLRETEVAARVGLSRTPVREALRDLVSMRFVELVPHKGARVRKMDRREFLEIYPVRAALEELAGTLAIGRMADRYDDLENAIIRMTRAFEVVRSLIAIVLMDETP